MDRSKTQKDILDGLKKEARQVDEHSNQLRKRKEEVEKLCKLYEWFEKGLPSPFCISGTNASEPEFVIPVAYESYAYLKSKLMEAIDHQIKEVSSL